MHSSTLVTSACHGNILAIKTRCTSSLFPAKSSGKIVYNNPLIEPRRHEGTNKPHRGAGATFILTQIHHIVEQTGLI